MSILKRVNLHRPVGRSVPPQSTVSRYYSADSHSHHHAEPPSTNGYLFGRPPGKYQMEYWEPVWYFGYYGALITLLVGHFFFKDTKTMEERATIEAQRRMALKGEKFGWPLPPDYAKVELVHE